MRAIAFMGLGALIAGLLLSIIKTSLKESLIEPTRFGIVDCAGIETRTLCLVKDDSTKKRYLLCMGCDIMEVKR